MAIEHQHSKPVSNGGRVDTEPAIGQWVLEIHDCELPNLQEIQSRMATVGSMWACNCGDKWKLVIDSERQRELVHGAPTPLKWLRINNKDKSRE